MWNINSYLFISRHLDMSTCSTYLAINKIIERIFNLQERIVTNVLVASISKKDSSSRHWPM